jgi:hypothetical protein
LLICICTISFPLKVDGGDTIGPAHAIVVSGDFTEGADGGVEEHLRTNQGEKQKTREACEIITLLGGTFETMTYRRVGLAIVRDDLATMAATAAA